MMVINSSNFTISERKLTVCSVSLAGIIKSKCFGCLAYPNFLHKKALISGEGWKSTYSSISLDSSELKLIVSGRLAPSKNGH